MIKIKSKQLNLAESTIQALTGLMNNYRKDFNRNIIANDMISLLLDEYINLINLGILPERNILQYIISKSTEATKSDENASTEKDELLAAADDIYNLFLLPTLDIEYLGVLLTIFKKKLAHSQRNHHHRRDEHTLEVSSLLSQRINFVNISKVESETKKKKTLNPFTKKGD